MQRKTLAFRYILSEELGEGAVATVWRAYDLVEDQPVAVKLLKDVLDAEDAARLQMEVSVVARLDHPNIIKFLDQGVTTQGQRFVVMELLTGETLREHLMEKTRMSGREALLLLKGVYSALEEAHRNRVVHRDIKPENVMLLYPDNRIKLLDFGMAKVVGGSVPSVTMTGRIFGTPHYMAPERIRGTSVHAPADIYSTGVMAFETLEGKRPFDADDAEEMMRMHLHRKPPEMTQEIHPRLVELVMSSLAKEPEARPFAGDALKIIEDLIENSDESDDELNSFS